MAAAQRHRQRKSRGGEGKGQAEGEAKIVALRRREAAPAAETIATVSFSRSFSLLNSRYVIRPAETSTAIEQSKQVKQEPAASRAANVARLAKPKPLAEAGQPTCNGCRPRRVGRAF